MSLSTIKILKLKNKSTWRNYDRRRIRKTWKVIRDSQKLYPKAFSWFTISYSEGIALKVKSNYEVEIHRSTSLCFWLKRVMNGKDRRLFTETMSRIKMIGLVYASMLRKEIGVLYLVQMKLHSILYHQVNINRFY